MVFFFHIIFFESYTLRHKQSQYRATYLQCVGNYCRFIPGYEPCSSSVSFCSISSNICVSCFILKKRKNGFVLVKSGKVLPIQFKQHYSTQVSVPKHHERIAYSCRTSPNSSFFKTERGHHFDSSVTRR